MKNKIKYFLQIKREPCQVSEVTTSNNLQSTNTVQQQSHLHSPLHNDHLPITNRSSYNNQSKNQRILPIVKIENKSPTDTSAPTSIVFSSSNSNMDHNNTNQVQTGKIKMIRHICVNVHLRVEIHLN